MNVISIPKPCHERWDQMSQQEQGRHCMSCSKTVIDFSNWENEAILNYLAAKQDEKVCGRFNVDQLEENPVQNLLPLILKSNISMLKKIAAVILLCFGVLNSGDVLAQSKMGKVKCTTTVSQNQLMGDTIVVQKDTAALVTPKIDTIHKPQIMGMIAPYKPKVEKMKIKKHK